MDTEDSDLPGQFHLITTHFPNPVENNNNVSQSNICQTSSNIQHHIEHLLTMRLTPSVLQTYTEKLQLLQKCSFYVEIILNEYPQYDHNYASNENVIQLVDPWMFQRMRKVANNQVKIQLALLEELLLMLSKGRQELADIIEQGLVLEENAIHERISYLHQAAAEFEDALVLHRFHIKYPLYSVSSCTVIPEMEMALSIKTPVIFEGNKCFATSDSIVLHWNVADQHKPGEQFEIHYKLLHPNNEAESKQMWKLTCPSYCLQINGLMPDRFYECAVKRVDTSFLVYGLWNDAIVLRTVLGTVENSEANRV